MSHNVSSHSRVELDERVVKNAENITSITERVEMNDFEMEKAREEVQKLSEENGKLKQSLNDIQSKSMINNLIIGGIEESDQESETQLENSVRSFFSDQLKIPEEKGNDIQFERIHRTGVKRASKPRNIVAVFMSKRDKDYVKSMRPGLRDTVFYMHDQYPTEILEQRKRLLPILKKAKSDNKDAYIKYNKLIIDGKIYTEGPYGKV